MWTRAARGVNIFMKPVHLTLGLGADHVSLVCSLMRDCFSPLLKRLVERTQGKGLVQHLAHGYIWPLPGELWQCSSVMRDETHLESGPGDLRSHKEG